MDAAAELALLETAYTNFIRTGVASYSINGRSITYRSIDEVTKRMDLLKIQIARAASGTFQASQFRDPE